MTDHPITPPPELVQQWGHDANLSGVPHNDEHWAYEQHIATRAAQYGADQELEACCGWLENVDCDDPQETAKLLRAARRPKRLSLKEQAIAELDDAVMRGDCITVSEALPTIRRALEQLDD